MDTLQIRLNKGLIKRIDFLVKQELYPSRSDAIRDAVRRLVLDKMIGIIPQEENSIKEIKQLRKKLSKERFNLNEINNLIN